MKGPRWTKRGAKRLRDAVVYIARNFYPDYALAFRDDVLGTADAAAKNPRIGVEAFPGMERPQYRKVLCRNRSWWVFYRAGADAVEVVSVKHTLQRATSLRDL